MGAGPAAGRLMVVRRNHETSETHATQKYGSEATARQGLTPFYFVRPLPPQAQSISVLSCSSIELPIVRQILEPAERSLRASK